MSDSDLTKQDPAPEIFVDPVAYLARFGIEAELIAATILPAAA